MSLIESPKQPHNSYKIARINGQYVWSEENYEAPKIIIKVNDSLEWRNIYYVDEMLTFYFGDLKKNASLDFPGFIYSFDSCYIMEAAMKIILENIEKPLNTTCPSCSSFFPTFGSLHDHKKSCKRLWMLNENEIILIETLKHYAKRHNKDLYLFDKTKKLTYRFNNTKREAWPFEAMTYEGTLEKLFGAKYKIIHETNQYSLVGHIKHESRKLKLRKMMNGI